MASPSGEAGPPQDSAPKRVGPREQSRKLLETILAQEDGGDAAGRARAIEDAVFDQHLDENVKGYRTSVRAMQGRLKGSRNRDIRLAVCCGEVTPADLVSLDDKTLEEKAAVAAKTLKPKVDGSRSWQTHKEFTSIAVSPTLNVAPAHDHALPSSHLVGAPVVPPALPEEGPVLEPATNEDLHTMVPEQTEAFLPGATGTPMPPAVDQVSAVTTLELPAQILQQHAREAFSWEASDDAQPSAQTALEKLRQARDSAKQLRSNVPFVPPRCGVTSRSGVNVRGDPSDVDAPLTGVQMPTRSNVFPVEVSAAKSDHNRPQEVHKEDVNSCREMTSRDTERQPPGAQCQADVAEAMDFGITANSSVTTPAGTRRLVEQNLKASVEENETLQKQLDILQCKLTNTLGENEKLKEVQLQAERERDQSARTATERDKLQSLTDNADLQHTQRALAEAQAELTAAQAAVQEQMLLVHRVEETASERVRQAERLAEDRIQEQAVAHVEDIRTMQQRQCGLNFLVESLTRELEMMRTERRCKVLGLVERSQKAVQEHRPFVPEAGTPAGAFGASRDLASVAHSACQIKTDPHPPSRPEAEVAIVTKTAAGLPTTVLSSRDVAAVSAATHENGSDHCTSIDAKASAIRTLHTTRVSLQPMSGAVGEHKHTSDSFASAATDVTLGTQHAPDVSTLANKTPSFPQQQERACLTPGLLNPLGNGFASTQEQPAFGVATPDSMFSAANTAAQNVDSSVSAADPSNVFNGSSTFAAHTTHGPSQAADASVSEPTSHPLPQASSVTGAFGIHSRVSERVDPAVSEFFGDTSLPPGTSDFFAGFEARAAQEPLPTPATSGISAVPPWSAPQVSVSQSFGEPSLNSAPAALASGGGVSGFFSEVATDDSWTTGGGPGLPAPAQPSGASSHPSPELNVGSDLFGGAPAQPDLFGRGGGTNFAPHDPPQAVSASFGGAPMAQQGSGVSDLFGDDDSAASAWFGGSQPCTAGEARPPCQNGVFGLDENNMSVGECLSGSLHAHCATRSTVPVEGQFSASPEGDVSSWF